MTGYYLRLNEVLCLAFITPLESILQGSEKGVQQVTEINMLTAVYSSENYSRNNNDTSTWSPLTSPVVVNSGTSGIKVELTHVGETRTAACVAVTMHPRIICFPEHAFTEFKWLSHRVSGLGLVSSRKCGQQHRGEIEKTTTCNVRLDDRFLPDTSERKLGQAVRRDMFFGLLKGLRLQGLECGSTNS